MKQHQSKIEPSSTYLNRFKILLPILLLAYIPLVVIFIIINSQNVIPARYLTRDPLAIVVQPFYLGIISNLGILFWCSAAAICFFTFAVLRKDSEQRIPKLFLLFSGLVTSVLLFDDFFLLHEDAFPNYLFIPEKLVYLGYGIMLSLYLIGFRKVILKTEFIPLFLAIGWFALSVLVDSGKIPQPSSLGGGKVGEVTSLLEDGAKLLGIVSWFVYYTMVCIKQIKDSRVQQIEVNCQDKEFHSETVR
ncbi:hypothetical protein [Coleofasciculus sp. FACHB-1120]|uniref:hypothetical protein n=1 Tax=Coleofasciculus sp. FACHB-1120 TaxID=2692783 RepID=UPI00168A06DF|nr:hypothetical protein [Coleofasciculus sp. FACHB-1120]MBD2745023.1 hypothetical protein [Coleofasciculus sp. FACHB-1120]